MSALTQRANWSFGRQIVVGRNWLHWFRKVSCVADEAAAFGRCWGCRYAGWQTKCKKPWICCAQLPNFYYVYRLVEEHKSICIFNFHVKRTLNTFWLGTMLQCHAETAWIRMYAFSVSKKDVRVLSMFLGLLIIMSIPGGLTHMCARTPYHRNYPSTFRQTKICTKVINWVFQAHYA